MSGMQVSRTPNTASCNQSAAVKQYTRGLLGARREGYTKKHLSGDGGGGGTFLRSSSGLTC